MPTLSSPRDSAVRRRNAESHVVPGLIGIRESRRACRRGVRSALSRQLRTRRVRCPSLCGLPNDSFPQLEVRCVHGPLRFPPSRSLRSSRHSTRGSRDARSSPTWSMSMNPKTAAALALVTTGFLFGCDKPPLEMRRRPSSAPPARCAASADSELTVGRSVAAAGGGGSRKPKSATDANPDTELTRRNATRRCLCRVKQTIIRIRSLPSAATTRRPRNPQMIGRLDRLERTLSVGSLQPSSTPEGLR